MPEIGAYDAKTHLSQLLDGVEEKGERYIITRHGQPVAELGPVRRDKAGEVRAALKQMDQLREELAGKGVALSDLLEEGESVRQAAHRGHRY